MTTTKVQNGEIMYADLFLDKLEADILFEDFITSLPFQQGTIKLFGKTHSIPRLEAFFASEKRIYSYSGVDLQTHDFTKELLVLKGKIEKIKEKFLYSLFTFNKSTSILSPTVASTSWIINISSPGLFCSAIISNFLIKLHPIFVE